MACRRPEDIFTAAASVEEMNAESALQILTEDNLDCPAGELRMYAEAFVLHRQASINVQESGPINAHPRTGAPIENPYMAVVGTQMKVMMALRRVRNTDRLWL